VVGLTAGASAPPQLVETVLAEFRGLGTISVDEHEVARETVQFSVPSVLRQT
jgi:4-hydroxy-3-methylbut-2-enyl diphosphate reductase